MIDLLLEASPDGKGDIAEVRFDALGQKVNLLTEDKLARLDGIIARLEDLARSGKLRGAVIASAKKGNFMAGADVKAFVGVARAGDAAIAAAKAREGQQVFSRLAALSVPTVAAVNGACLGGGLELALACSSRVASDAEVVSLGLPEVRLGLIPGWGGTQRLPRLVGLAAALDLILTGRSVGARQALRLGLVDAVVAPEALPAAAREQILVLAGGGAAARRPAGGGLERVPMSRLLILAMARRRARAQTRGHYPAPESAIAAVRHGLQAGIESGLAREAELVGRLIVGDVSKNLVAIFLSSRGMSAEVAPASDAVRPSRRIERIGVIGAGTMGGGIAAVAAAAGLPVRLKDVGAEALAPGLRQVHDLARWRARKGRATREQARRLVALVTPTTDSVGFGRCDLIIEAVVEDLEVKRRLVRELEALTAPDAIIATNTSSLSVAAIAEGAGRPGRILGLHFFNPPQKMPLVEVVRGPATDAEAVEAAVQLARRLGKTPVVVKDTPGFIVNRVLMPYLAGALDLLAAGSVVEEVDRAMVAFGMPVGPFALLDRIGLDVAAKVSSVLKAAFPERPGDASLLHAMLQAGHLGVKSGKGFYRWRGAGASARPAGASPDVAPLLAATYRGPVEGVASAPAGATPRGAGAAPAEAIVDVLVDVMVDESARLLDEGAVERPDVVDLALVLGAGFPPFRGGPLRHADAVGHSLIAERLERRGRRPAASLRREERFYT